MPIWRPNFRVFPIRNRNSIINIVSLSFFWWYNWHNLRIKMALSAVQSKASCKRVEPDAPLWEADTIPGSPEISPKTAPTHKDIPPTEPPKVSRHTQFTCEYVHVCTQFPNMIKSTKDTWFGLGGPKKDILKTNWFDVYKSFPMYTRSSMI